MANIPVPPDPFPDIAPALLNSADIEAYCLSTNLFTPFVAKKLKPASYEIPFAGDIYFWKPDDVSVNSVTLGPSDTFTIQPNEIVFISPSVEFRIPWYLALRFNLHISLVHRGLLLGTGPLVDPGFQGRLLVPVHNLTSSPVTIAEGMGFIWVEVTKLSPYPVKSSASFDYREFPPGKRGLTALQYFERANNLQPIGSTLRDNAQRLKSGLEDLARLQEQQTRQFSRLSLWSGLATAVGVVALLLAAASLYRDFHQYVGDTKKNFEEDTKKAFAEEVKKVQSETDKLKLELQQQRHDLEALKKQMPMKK